MLKIDLEKIEKILNNADKVISIYENNQQEENDINEYDLVDLVINMRTIIEHNNKVRSLKEID